MKAAVCAGKHHLFLLDLHCARHEGKATFSAADESAAYSRPYDDIKPLKSDLGAIETLGLGVSSRGRPESSFGLPSSVNETRKTTITVSQGARNPQLAVGRVQTVNSYNHGAVAVAQRRFKYEGKRFS